MFAIIESFSFCVRRCTKGLVYVYFNFSRFVCSLYVFFCHFFFVKFLNILSKLFPLILYLLFHISSPLPSPPPVFAPLSVYLFPFHSRQRFFRLFHYSPVQVQVLVAHNKNKEIAFQMKSSLHWIREVRQVVSALSFLFLGCVLFISVRLFHSIPCELNTLRVEMDNLIWLWESFIGTYYQLKLSPNKSIIIKRIDRRC